MTQETNLDFIQGESKDPTFGRMIDLLLPSGLTVTIREQNGNDDDVLSSQSKDDLDSNGINRFVAGIIMKNDFPFAKTQGKITDKEVLKMPLRDKYFIVVSSRVFSLGNLLKFEWDWQNGELPIAYEDDLSLYLWDYKKEFPKEGEDNYFKERIKPYTNVSNDNPVREFTLTSGKTIRYKLLNGESENFLLKLPLEKRTVNAGLKARKLQLFVEDDWLDVVNFSSFNPREMAEIRRDIEQYDSQFDGITTIENPNTGQTLDIPLMNIPDFFFPREI